MIQSSAHSVDARIAVLAGDGVGPEVIGGACLVLSEVAKQFGHTFAFTDGLIGGSAIDVTGSPLPPETLRVCEQSDAVLLGAVGGPRWDDPGSTVRPEDGLLALRRALGCFAN